MDSKKKPEMVAGRAVFYKGIGEEVRAELQELLEQYPWLLPVCGRLTITWGRDSETNYLLWSELYPKRSVADIYLTERWWDLAPEQRRHEYVSNMVVDRWLEQGILWLEEDGLCLEYKGRVLREQEAQNRIDEVVRTWAALPQLGSARNNLRLL